MFGKCLEYYSINFRNKHIWDLLEIPKSTYYKLIKNDSLKLIHYKKICNCLDIQLTDDKKIILSKILEIAYVHH